jgi:hypothetical protein
MQSPLQLKYKSLEGLDNILFFYQLDPFPNPCNPLATQATAKVELENCVLFSA